MKRKRIMIVITVDLDPTPGAFHEAENAVALIEDQLNHSISHYNPKVELAGELLEESPH